MVGASCSSAGAERNWSAFSRVHTKYKARLNHELVEKLVFVLFKCFENLDENFEITLDLNDEEMEVMEID